MFYGKREIEAKEQAEIGDEWREFDGGKEDVFKGGDYSIAAQPLSPSQSQNDWNGNGKAGSA